MSARFSYLWSGCIRGTVRKVYFPLSFFCEGGGGWGGGRTSYFPTHISLRILFFFFF